MLGQEGILRVRYVHFLLWSNSECRHPERSFSENRSEKTIGIAETSNTAERVRRDWGTSVPPDSHNAMGHGQVSHFHNWLRGVRKSPCTLGSLVVISSTTRLLREEDAPKKQSVPSTGHLNQAADEQILTAQLNHPQTSTECLLRAQQGYESGQGLGPDAWCITIRKFFGQNLGACSNAIPLDRGSSFIMNSPYHVMLLMHQAFPENRN